jgi:hypothetical protein
MHWQNFIRIIKANDGFIKFNVPKTPNWQPDLSIWRGHNAKLGSGQGIELYIKNVCLFLDNCQNLFQLE